MSDSQRKRAAVSCDRCKTRKVRCIRIGNDEASCAACAQLGLECVAAIPRKQRVYASYEQLEARYRALDAFVRQSYPGEILDTAEDIRDLARRRGIDLDPGVDLVRSEPPGTMSIDRVVPLTLFGAAPSTSAPREVSDESVLRLQIPEGSLIPGPKGAYHYVGPASSYCFANTIRQLVRRSNPNGPALDRAAYRRQQRAEEFTTAKRTNALEARIPDHPLMAVEEGGDVTSSPANAGNDPSVVSPFAASTPRSEARSVAPWTVDLLPARPLADQLVSAYFDRLHPDFSLFHRGTFQMRYEAIWRSHETLDTAALEPGWLCALYMVFVFGAQAMERQGFADSKVVQTRYLGIVVRQGLQRLVLTATLPNIQALALLSLYQYNGGERNAAWMLIGHASRMAIALGLQRDGHASTFDFVERNLRRTVWWTLFLFEHNLSFILGRPSATSTVDTTARLPDDSLLDGSIAPPGLLQQAVRLGGQSAKIKRFVASVSADYDKVDAMQRSVDLAEALSRSLSVFEQDLEPHLRVDAPFASPKHTRAVLLLHINLHHLRALVGRPFLLCTVNRNLADTSPGFDSGSYGRIERLAQDTLDAARTCLRLLLRLSDAGLLEGELWHDFYYVHHSCLVVSLPFLTDIYDSRRVQDRDLIYGMLQIASKTHLAPTYSILINVCIQLARIVSIGPDDIYSAPSSPLPFRGAVQADIPYASPMASSQLHSRKSTSDDEQDTPGGTHETAWNPFDTPGSGFDPNLASANSGSGPAGSFAPPVVAENAATGTDETSTQWSFLPLLNDIGSQSLSLEQLMGMPPFTASLQQPSDTSVPALDFSDLHNFGFGFETTDSSRAEQIGSRSRGDPQQREWGAGVFDWDFFGQ